MNWKTAIGTASHLLACDGTELFDLENERREKKIHGLASTVLPILSVVFIV